MAHFDLKRLDRVRQQAFSELPNIASARAHSDDLLTKMRQMDHALNSNSNVLICAVGSLARREASTQSDLDFFSIYQKPESEQRIGGPIREVSDALIKMGGRAPAEGGAFDHEVEDIETMLANIGGDEDVNQKITRRVLFLLEGEWLTNEPMLRATRRQFVERYVKSSITAHQMALFLLNDIIRYYRTMCVDFEFKTVEAQKPWGTRNIKLIFSRKLLYFTGVLAVAETVQRSYEEKREILLELFDMPVVDRMLAVCGERALGALRLYDRFLGEMSKPEIRKALDATTVDTRQSEVFRRLKDDGHHFSWELLSLFQHIYPPSHPIHRAIFL